jgi:4-aminobutyrate aminotransferase-like enzyme
MGNGIPIAGVVGRPDLFDDFATRTRYFNTFGGNPVSCAAAMAVLDVLRDEALMQNAAMVGAYLRAGLSALAARVPSIGDVRGDGLFIALEFVTDRDSRAPDGALAGRVVNAMRRRHVLISASGIHGNTLKIRPPLPFGVKHADLVLEALAASLDDG